jgi:hypothetical protein
LVTPPVFAAKPQANVGQFVKGIAQTGAKNAGYFAPELKIAKAPTLAAKFVNGAVPGAVTGVLGAAASGVRDPKELLKDAALAGGVNGVGNAAGHLVSGATRGKAAAVEREVAPKLTAVPEPKVPLKATPTELPPPPVEPTPIPPAPTPKGQKQRKFIGSVKNSDEVSPEVQQAVEGTYTPKIQPDATRYLSSL